MRKPILMVAALCLGLAASTATAVPRPPRPSVERVKIFTCSGQRAFQCADDLEEEYARWTADNPDVRIRERQVSVGVGQSDAGNSYEGRRNTTVVMTLSVFYEVAVRAEKRLPAERAP